MTTTNRTLVLAIRATVGSTTDLTAADLREQAGACEVFARMYWDKGCRNLALNYAGKANRLRRLALTRAGV